MNEHWERLAEAQRVKQQIEAEFMAALAQVGREAAERIRRSTHESRDLRTDFGAPTKG